MVFSIGVVQLFVATSMLTHHLQRFDDFLHCDAPIVSNWKGAWRALLFRKQRATTCTDSMTIVTLPITNQAASAVKLSSLEPSRHQCSCLVHSRHELLSPSTYTYIENENYFTSWLSLLAQQQILNQEISNLTLNQSWKSTRCNSRRHRVCSSKRKPSHAGFRFAIRKYSDRICDTEKVTLPFRTRKQASENWTQK